MHGSTLLRQTWTGLKLLVVFTAVLGVGYPLAVWGVSRAPGLHHQAEGSIVTDHGRPVGSSQIGLNPVDPHAAANPTQDRYFHTRPSAQAVDYSTSDPHQLGLGPIDPSSSGGSNLAQDNTVLTQQINARRAWIAAREGAPPDQVPADAVTASASGLGPGISPVYAFLQAPRVARVTGLPLAVVRRIVDEHFAGRPLGVLGEPTVNVLALNRAIADAAPVAQPRPLPGR